jgi:hypothetical protein
MKKLKFLDYIKQLFNKQSDKESTCRAGTGILTVKAENLNNIKAIADIVIPMTKGQCLRDVLKTNIFKRIKSKFLGIKLVDLTDLPKEFHNFVADDDLIFIGDTNAYVNTGLSNSLLREFGLGGTAVGYIGVSSNTTAVTASTVYLNGTVAGTAANTIIKAISPTATISGQTVTAGATFANADFTSGVFVMNKLGLLTTSTDAGTGLVDVIGGTGGTNPYNLTFSLDLTGAGSFSVTIQIAVTASAA